MISEETKRKLVELKIPELAEGIQFIELNTVDFINMTFSEKLDMAIDHLYNCKYNEAVVNIKKRAHLRFPNADFRDIHYNDHRAITPEIVQTLATCDFVINHTNLVFHGPCGTGKTWIANAVANEAARKKMKVLYIRAPKLFEIHREERRLGKSLSQIVKKYAKYDLLILDEFLMYDLEQTDLQFIAELIEVRYDTSSTVFCSQYPTSDWYEKLGSTTLTEALLDRIVHNMINLDMGTHNFRQKSIK